jgi:hypothetical protein
MAEYVTLKDLSAEFGLDRSNLRKYLLANDFEFVKVRTAESGHQLTLALTLEDAEAARTLRENEGYFRKTIVIENGYGYFYIIQLVPEFDPLRVKLGFASNVDTRLQAHRTAAPTAKLIKAWRCKKIWEQTAIDSITRCDCKLIMNEVFTCDSIDALVERTDRFFEIMPDTARHS